MTFLIFLTGLVIPARVSLVFILFYIWEHAGTILYLSNIQLAQTSMSTSWQTLPHVIFAVASFRLSSKFCYLKLFVCNWKMYFINYKRQQKKSYPSLYPSLRLLKTNSFFLLYLPPSLVFSPIKEFNSSNSDLLELSICSIKKKLLILNHGIHWIKNSLNQHSRNLQKQPVVLHQIKQCYFEKSRSRSFHKFWIVWHL